MIKGVLLGAVLPPNLRKYTAAHGGPDAGEYYTLQKTAAAEGGITGAGGILMFLQIFSITDWYQNKMLFDIASRYGG
jgi:hypothetical protein